MSLGLEVLRTSPGATGVNVLVPGLAKAPEIYIMMDLASNDPEASKLAPERTLKLPAFVQQPDGIPLSQQVFPAGIVVPVGQVGSRFSQ